MNLKKNFTKNFNGLILNFKFKFFGFTKFLLWLDVFIYFEGGRSVRTSGIS